MTNKEDQVKKYSKINKEELIELLIMAEEDSKTYFAQHMDVCKQLRKSKDVIRLIKLSLEVEV